MWDAPYAEGQRNSVEGGALRFAYVDKFQVKRGPDAQLLDHNDKRVPGKAGNLKSKTMAYSDNQGGGHAEEYFLRRMLSLANAGNVPTQIELFISRIPCASSSMMWRFDFQGNLITLPAGCGAKLLTAVQMTPGTQWDIAYGQGYANVATQAPSAAWISQINAQPNANAGNIAHFL